MTGMYCTIIERRTNPNYVIYWEVYSANPNTPQDARNQDHPEVDRVRRYSDMPRKD